MPINHFRHAVPALLFSAMAAGSLCGAGAAEPYPSRNIRIVIPGGPGTPPDIVPRVVANQVSEAEGWRFVIENKPGAIQTLAGSEVLKSPPDGYSIFAQAMPISSAPTMLANMPFNLVTDFRPVARLSASYNVLVVNPSVPANSVAELVALIRSKPDELTFSSGGAGTPAHLIGELFKLQNGLRATHVPYPTNFSNAIADLLNGTNHARRHRGAAQHRHQQGVDDAEGQGRVRPDRRRAGRWNAGELRRLSQTAGRILGQGREGGGHPA
ncbi:MAG: tripartite tricarboxylate transporter substrate binding protein, partial [Xanthobacteraceae bacterium]